MIRKKKREGGTCLNYIGNRNGALAVDVNLKPGVEGQHAVSKTDLSVGP